jgi:hypothetical protein
MAIEPTSVQRDRMLSRGKTKLILIQFLIGKDPAKIEEYFTLSGQAVLAEGGKRRYLLRIDQTLVGGTFPYQYLSVDSFPSSQALLMAHENTREIRLAALQEIYGIYLKSKSTLNKAVRAAGMLAPSLGRWLGTQEKKEYPLASDELDPVTDPDPEVIREFSSRDQDQPVYMMNLNQFAPQDSKLYVSGKAAYKRYSTRITPYLISVGGFPVIFDKPLGTYIGHQQNSLYNSWGEFGLVFYPSRASFLRLLTNAPRRAAAYRRVGLKKAVLMACLKQP